MKESSRDELIHRISDLVMRWQDATQRFDDEVGTRYGLTLADRHCLTLLHDGPRAPSVIAREIGLTPPSVTALVDRLEKRGFLARERDATDRRKMLIFATAKTRTLAQTHYRPIADAARDQLLRYSLEELATVAKFTADALALQLDAIGRLKEWRERAGES